MSRAPFLLIDAGNSRVKWSLVQSDGKHTHAGVFTHSGLLVKGIGDPLDFEHEPDWAELPTPGSAWLSNVAGEAVARRIDTLLDACWQDLPRTTIRSLAQQCGVRNQYATPASLGSDRWAGMIGARAAFPGEDLLVATFGTATTLEALRADGAFIGGLIAPGWSLMMRSLGEHTAQLPVLDIRPADNPLADDETHGAASGGLFFATDTRRSMASGCALAQAAFVERMWHKLQEEWRVPVRLVVGGGAADEVAGMLNAPHTRHDALVLSGLALIAADSTATRPV
ncbi:MAG TPA: type III pantothenate kinase [Paraburkholderia sp.]|jgi:type III pantothenate kinase